MEDALKREEWDFSDLEEDELVPALLWEAQRECVDVDEIALNVQAWLDGELSTKKPPMARDKRSGKRPRHNINFSEADSACISALAAFDEFIPLNEFSFLHKWKASQRHVEWDRWLAGYLRPVLNNRDVPWLCLKAEERRRICGIVDRNSDANVVKVGSWWEAVGRFRKTDPDGGLPLKFDYHEYTSVLLTINWSYSKKRILAAIGKLLKKVEPSDMTRIPRWDRRGKKDRDLLVMLERFALMRLLHYYTLSELKRLLPDAWNRYGHRKWYDERRQALLDFRKVRGCRDTDYFPKRWLTKAHRTRKTPELPAK